MMKVELVIKDGFLVVRLIEAHDQGDYIMSEDRVALADLQKQASKT